MFILKALRFIKLHEIPTRIFITPTENEYLRIPSDH
jgi:hypothetical protein